LIVGDLDRFKRVNDEHGHATGDELLVGVAQAIAGAKRGFDSAARVGGEEFAVLAPDCDDHGAFMLAERMRAAVHEAVISRDPDSSLTISFGISTCPLHGQSADALLRTADQALYAAKRLGRNRSVISSAEVPGILARAPRHADEEAQVELASLLNLAEALDVRDWGSASHCRRVGRFAELTARELGLSPEAVERVRLAGILHDVGRVALPDDAPTPWPARA
jgi:diguanylate cyclase (GGDEF)-like protein